jgi:Tfp pilus assembly protein PilF
MTITLSRNHTSTILLLLFGTLILAVAGCRTDTQLPQKSSSKYNEFVRAFYVGLAALQVGDDVRADAKLAQATQLVPEEPASWANWGMLALRQRNFDAAAERLERARTLAPDNDQVLYLLGLVESGRGRAPEAFNYLRKAFERNPQNLRAAYRLAEEIERQSGDESEAEFQRLMEKILAVRPDNLAALLELGRVAARRNDGETLRRVVAQITARSAGWPTEAQQQLSALQAAAQGNDLHRAAATRITFLRNVLVRVPEYRQSLSLIKPPPGEEAEAFTTFLRLETPTFRPAPADTSLAFAPEQLPSPDAARWNWIGAVALNAEGAQAIVKASGREVRLASGRAYPFPGGPSNVPPRPEGIAALDFNYDFKTDLVLAGAGGLRLLRQETPDAFTDVTSQSKLSPSVTGAAYTGAWAADIEADGDLDIVLGAESGQPLILRNNGDGSFAEAHPFAASSGLKGFAWADMDADGDPDAALIDAGGRLHVYSNERTGQFNERPLPQDFPQVKAINVADVNSDGVLDLLAVQTSGVMVRLSDKDEGKAFESSEIARVADATGFLEQELRLRVADLDNNGSLDLLLSSTAYHPSNTSPNAAGALLWLGDEQGKFSLLNNLASPALVFDIADINGDGRLDLLGLSAEGQAMQAINRGAKSYHWQVVRPRAAQAVGDQRINSFGVGGEMEIRSGLLVQKQLMRGPLVHFGLGEQESADVVRIVWPNGSVRAEFEVQADQAIAAEQRLKGSCPFLFAFNGHEMKFVKDAVPWGSAIGLRINTLGTASVEATEEWYKIARDELAPRDGYYDLRITGELWETYYYDHLALMTVDHPAGTEIFVDERFVIPPVKLKVTVTKTPHKIRGALDDNGQDVTEVVRDLDGKYLDTFGRGAYQGVTRDHFVEIDLGEDAPKSGPLWLIARGWMHPTDSSINVAISQGESVRAKPLSLEVPDGRGGWVVAEPNLGFPAGRRKICLFDLSKVFRPNTPRRVRLRTNLEVFWDSIEWAEGLPGEELRINRLSPDTADLHYRGYSVIDQPNSSSPEVPDYNRLAASKQIWRDLIGYYTRFGDVRELLLNADDRYVIMNSGDEMTFRFGVPELAPSGWVRDFIIAGDGWIKDGDFNSTFSKTVLPLPYHDKREYTTPPGRLEDERVYRLHPEDWQTYHTRYITPEVFQNTLRQKKQR